MDAKQLTVITGPRGNTQSHNVTLNDIPPEQWLTPAIARRAVRIAQGHTEAAATVIDQEFGHSYRVYKRSARKREAD